jgi:hypothetical protein
VEAQLEAFIIPRQSLQINRRAGLQIPEATVG